MNNTKPNYQIGPGSVLPLTQQGWVCSKCGASNSPLVQQCPSCVGVYRPNDPMTVPAWPNTTYSNVGETTPGATYGNQLLTEHSDKSSF